VPVVRGERLPFWAVFGRIAPFGASLCLASIGYGTLTTFITLYYLNRGWTGAAYCLTVFGVCFILSRLLFISGISRFGGFTGDCLHDHRNPRPDVAVAGALDRLALIGAG
jgi:hypothetical protein